MPSIRNRGQGNVCLAPSEQRVALELRIVGSSPILSVEITQKFGKNVHKQYQEFLHPFNPTLSNVNISHNHSMTIKTKKAVFKICVRSH